MIHAAALAYMQGRAPAGPAIGLLANQADRHFPDPAAWAAHLERLGIRGMEGRLPGRQHMG